MLFNDSAWSAAFFRALLLAVPLCVLDVTLRLVGASERLRFVVPGAKAHLWPLIPSTLFIHIGVFFFIAGISLMLQGRRLAWLGVIGLQALVLTVALFHLTAYVYLMRAVSTLDWSIVAYALRRPDSASTVALGEIGMLEWVIIVAFVATTLGHPLILWRFADTRTSIPAWTSVTMGVLISMLALPSMTLSLLTPFAHDIDSSMLRDPLVNVYVSYLADQQRDEGADTTAPPTGGQFLGAPVEIERKPDAPPPRNVAVIILESFRAESTTAYTPSLATTPFLARLAQDAVQVDRAYTLVPATTKSLVSILCGLPPSRGIPPQSFNRELLSRCLPQLLSNAGYDTVFMQTANEKFDRRDKMVRDMGFASFIGPAQLPKQGFEQVNFLGTEDEALLEPNRAFLEAHRSRPLFATYLSLNCHHDILPLSRYPTVAFAQGDGLNRYLNAMHSDDFFLEKLFAQYKELGLYEKTLFIIVGDHGEGWGEHGRFTHVNTPYEEGVHVPLWVVDPSHQLFSPAHLPGPTDHQDLMPTLLDLLGYRVAKGVLPGESIFHRTPGRPIDIACFGECIARVQDNWKMIYFFSERPEELYDLSVDPHELNNVFDKYPDVAERMRGGAVEAQRAQDRFYWFHNLRAEKAKQGGN